METQVPHEWRLSTEDDVVMLAQRPLVSPFELRKLWVPLRAELEGTTPIIYASDVFVIENNWQVIPTVQVTHGGSARKTPFI